jgi:GTP-sensing pleiotropic transcriptional regulator CodY
MLPASAAIVAEVRKQSREAAIWNLDLQPTSKLLLLALDKKADDANLCRVTVDYLVSRVGVTRMTIFVTLNTLEGAGLLTRARRPGSATTYTLHVQEPRA